MARLNPTLVGWLYAWGDWSRQTCQPLGYPSITAEARLLVSPGRATGIKPAVPRYRPDPVARRVEDAMGRLEDLPRVLLEARYRDGMSAKRISGLMGNGYGAARWAVEKAHREIARVLEIPVYRR